MALSPLSWIRNALRVNPANPQSATQFFFGLGHNNAGVHVTHQSAFMSAAVWACIDVVASSLAASDWNVYQGVRGADDKEAIPADNLQYVLNTRPNPEMTAQAAKRAMMIGAVGYGNGYAEIERDMSRRVVALWPISPDRVTPIRNEFGNFVYRVTQDYAGGTVDLDPSDVYHIRGASLVGSVGDDMIAKAIQTISRSIAIDQFSSAYFGNNAQLGTIFQSDSSINPDKKKEMEDGIKERYSGPRKSHTPAIFEGKWTIHQLSNNADDAQLIEAKYQIIEEVCRWFRVPPHKIAHLLRATNNNIEHQGLEFSRDTLRPWIQEIQQEADFKLIPSRQQKFIEIDVDWASEGDFGSRMQGFSTGINSGVYSVNDVLRKLGENTIGPSGDVRMVQGAMMKLEDVGKNMMPQPGKTPAPGNAVAAAWLESVYGRIQRRFENRSKDSGIEAASADFEVYANSQLSELSDALSGRIELARATAVEVAAKNLTPKQAAARVFTEELA
jgi:HK97 family phage portal protein